MNASSCMPRLYILYVIEEFEKTVFSSLSRRFSATLFIFIRPDSARRSRKSGCARAGGTLAAWRGGHRLCRTCPSCRNTFPSGPAYLEAGQAVGTVRWRIPSGTCVRPCGKGRRKRPSFRWDFPQTSILLLPCPAIRQYSAPCRPCPSLRRRLRFRLYSS